jgi:rod shape-determining protein MreC
MPKKNFRVFLSLVAVSVLLMTYQSQMGTLRPFRFLSTPLNYANQSITSVLATARVTLRVISSDKEELKRLREEVRLLKLEKQGLEEMRSENRRLADMLELKKRKPEYLTAARVIGRGLDRWANSFVIDKGTEDLVEKDMAVATDEGLLGKIQDAQGGFSTVLLIDDRGFSAAVRLQKSRTEAVLAGAGGGKCVLRYLPTDHDVEEGEAVVTSGLGALFPPGIRAGHVSSVYTDPEEIFHEIEVIPFVDTKKVEEVIILNR